MNTQLAEAISNRRYDIDWLRISAVLLLIPYHTARIFDIWQPFYAKNQQTSPLLSYFVSVVDPWHMPLFFLLSGAATYYALGFRSNSQYIGERLKRLAVPLLFGLVVIIPPQSYFAVLTQHGDPGSLLSFYPHFFQVKNGDLSGYFGGFTPGHLWFILFLLVFSILALPMFRYWRQHPRFVEQLVIFCEKRGAIYLLAIPVGIAGILPDLGGKNPCYYLMFFIFGYLLMSDARFQNVIDRQMWLSLGLGVATMSAILILILIGADFPKDSLGDICSYLIRTFNSWLWVLALLGLGHKYLNTPRRWLSYANEAAYPFYILHQTVIVIIGFYVVQTELDLAIKFGLIALLSLFTTLILYDVLVRRINVLRFLFGMRSKSPHPHTSMQSQPKLVS